MIYSEFKTALDAVLYADTKAPAEDEVLIPIVMLELRAIAYRCEPLALLVKSPDFRIIRALDDGESYIRESSKIIDDDSKIDIDKELTDAVVFGVASRITKRKHEYYDREKTRVIADYNFKMLEARNGN